MFFGKRNRYHVQFLTIAVAGLIGSGYSAPVSAKEASEAEYTMKFTIAHKPEKYFLSMAETLKSRLKQKTNGAIAVDIDVSDDFSGRVSTDSRGNMLQSIKEGEQTIGQVYVGRVSELYEPLRVFKLPFIFQDYAHVENVLEGEVGQELLAGFNDSQDEYVGLAYTFSGGFRNFATRNKVIERYEDLVGLNVRAFSGIVSRDIMKKLNADPYYTNKDLPKGQLNNFINAFDTQTVEAAEVTAPDVGAAINSPQKHPANVLNVTRHALTSTMLVVDADFMNKLPEKYRKIVKETARKAASAERHHIIQDGKRVKKSLKKRDDVTVNVMSDRQRKRMKAQLQPIYDQYEEKIGKSLIERVIQADENRDEHVRLNK